MFFQNSTFLFIDSLVCFKAIAVSKGFVVQRSSVMRERLLIIMMKFFKYYIPKYNKTYFSLSLYTVSFGGFENSVLQDLK